jgi:hypothetical protein
VAERFWIGDVVAGDPSNRNRDAEFLVHGLSGQELKDRLSDSLAYIRNQLAALKLQDLATPRLSQRFRRASSAWPGHCSTSWNILRCTSVTSR